MIAQEDLAGGRVLRLQAGMIPIRHLSLALLTGGCIGVGLNGLRAVHFATHALEPA